MTDTRTPLVDEYFAGIDTVTLQAIAQLDDENPPFTLGYQLRAWETLSRRLAPGGSPDDPYLADDYVNDLDIRDALKQRCGALPSAAQPPLCRLLDQLDERFKAVTKDDGGAALDWRMAREDTALRDWWWRRSPLLHTLEE